MATSPMSEVIRHLRRTVLLREEVSRTDGQLLEDYLSGHDESALAALVERHGPMVWGVCRRILGNYHDAEDAFQATFLVFVRKAASIASRALLANWLYGVAQQTALKARATAARRKGRERQLAKMPEPAAAEQELWHDLQPLFDRELSRLPYKYRVVVVLCDLEGKTRREAARQLGCPEGTVAGRLARARILLAKRLARYGLAVSGGALGTILSQKAASAGVPTAVVCATIEAVRLFAPGQAAGMISANVAVLTEGMLKTMLLSKLRTASTVLLMIVLIGIGGGATALLAGDGYQYQPPGIGPATVADGIITQPVEVALDAAGGRAKPYFYYPPDPSNINHLWKLTKVGDYYMIESKLGELALDASGGKGNPYLRHSDPTNINHLWQLMKVDACYLIVPKVGDGELALDANGGKGNPYLRKADTTNNNQLWELRKTGDYYLLVPLVRRMIDAATPRTQPDGRLPKAPGTTTKEEVRRQIEKMVERAEAGGADRRTLLDDIEKTVKEMKKKAKKY
jgi:RNA polymerase sigma factor (sigma-70 family)